MEDYKLNIICPSCQCNILNHDDLLCQLNIAKEINGFTYDYKKLMFKVYRNKFLLNQVLNNNAKIIYDKFPYESLAMPGRNLVRSQYIKDRIKRFPLVNRPMRLLDIGCGPQILPEYLTNLNKDLDLYGIDPLDNPNYTGFKINGVAEFLPFENNTFDYVLFSGSIDQVVDVKKSISEAIRVMQPYGRLMFRLNGNPKPLITLSNFIKNLLNYLLTGINRNKFLIYDDYTTLLIPFGAIDPFHLNLVSEQKIKTLIKKSGLIVLSNEIVEGNVMIEFGFTKF